MATRFSASLALIAFAAVCAQGMVTGLTADQGAAFPAIIKRALVAMAIFGASGMVIGTLACRAVDESVAREIETLEAAERSEAPPADGSTSEGEPPPADEAWPPRAAETPTAGTPPADGAPS